MLGKTIKSLLSANSTLVGLVSTKIYPYVIPADTALPAIAYTIESLTPDYTKGGWALDEIYFNVHSFHTNYNDLQTVVTNVRSALELKTTGSGTQDINRIYLVTQDEGYEYEGGFYHNTLGFKVRINTY